MELGKTLFCFRSVHFMVCANIEQQQEITVYSCGRKELNQSWFKVSVAKNLRFWCILIAYWHSPCTTMKMSCGQSSFLLRALQLDVNLMDILAIHHGWFSKKRKRESARDKAETWDDVGLNVWKHIKWQHIKILKSNSCRSLFSAVFS